MNRLRQSSPKPLLSHADALGRDFVCLFEQFGLGQRPLFDLDDIASARATMAALAQGAIAAMPGDGAISVEAIDIASADGEPLSVRVTRPAGTVRSRGLLVWAHGGGYVMGAAIDDDPLARELALKFGVTVVTFDYRLAPEHPFPAAHEDALAAWQWACTQLPDATGEFPRVLGGFSAGGGLAAGLALALRGTGIAMPEALLLDAPMLDDSSVVSQADDDGTAGIWNAATNRLAWSYYLAGGTTDARAAPARCADPAGLPQTYLSVGGADFFRDEVLEFAARLARAGVATEFHLYPGGCHGFAGLNPGAAIARSACASRDAFLARIFAAA